MAAQTPRTPSTSGAHLSDPALTERRTWEDLYTAEDAAAWRARTRIFLSPIAAPSILGLFGFMTATLMVGAWQAGWYGGPTTPLVIWPFALFAGGLLQIIACAACFRARDGVALAVHGIWGAFWIGWSVLQLLVATHVLPSIPLGATNSTFAFWFIALALVTGSAMFAALAQNIGTFLVLGALAAGSALSAAGFYAGSLGVVQIGGWLFVASAGMAWLTATAMMLEHAFGRTIIPLGKWSRAGNVPGRTPTLPMSYSEGMPGARVGQ